MQKKQIFGWIKITLIVYALIGIGLYFIQDKLLFHPIEVEPNKPYLFNQPHKELMIPFDEKTSFHLVQFTVADSIKKGVVLYFHGNKNNISHYEKYATHFTRNNYEVWMIDYPGFGKSKGNLTETILYEEALQLYQLARKQYQPNQIIIYGKSIGTGIAAQLASIRDCRHLILETPYYGLENLINHYLWMYPLHQLLHFKFPTYQYLAKVTAPLHIFHGTADELIPYHQALNLKKLFKPTDELITIEKGKHNNLFDFDLANQQLNKILQQ